MNSSGIVAFKFGTNLRLFGEIYYHYILFLKLRQLIIRKYLVYLCQPRRHHVIEE
jgi:hypothetical protein